MVLKSESNLVLDVQELNAELKKAHAPAGWKTATQWFDKNFGTNATGSRLKFLAGILCTDKPITFTDDLKNQNVESFHILQGDVIRSTAGLVPHPMSEFTEGENYYYLVVPSSCSAQRYKYVLTARLVPVLKGDKAAEKLLSDAVNLKTHKFFYVPPQSEQPDHCLGNLANLQEISYFPQDLLKVADRTMSMSEVGWHLFNAFLTFHFTRLSEEEFKIRKDTFESKMEISG